MNRIFLTLAVFVNLCLLGVFALGWSIGDVRTVDAGVQRAVALHMLCALGAALLVLLVHAVVLTYFMGTGRWIEETCAAYRLDTSARARNIRMKYRVIPGMVACIVLVVVTGAYGAMSDPSADQSTGSAHVIHFGLAIALVSLNLLVSWAEYSLIVRNGELVQAIVAEVRRIRSEHGLENS